MSNDHLRRMLEDLQLLGFAKQSTLDLSATSTITNVENDAEALIKSVTAKVGQKPGGGGDGGDDGGTPSDVMLKRDIQQVATREDGLRLYSFKYLWDEAVHVGVMAQDLLRNETWRPAVCRTNGYYTVNYGLLGLRMTTLDEWEARGLNALRA